MLPESRRVAATPDSASPTVASFDGDLQPSDFPRLAPDLETTIFRIVQEALANVFRHSEGAQS
jgi:signal transduction histidine kinase